MIQINDLNRIKYYDLSFVEKCARAAFGKDRLDSFSFQVECMILTRPLAAPEDKRFEGI